jgi:hypothetical protein
VEFLEQQHEQIKAAFARVKGAHGTEREQAFVDLRRLLAVHETAEEEIVHPIARRELPDGEAVVSVRLKEEHQAKQVLADLEKLDVQNPAFESQLAMLEQSVLAHATAEERQEFERLGELLDQPRLERMRTAAEFAEKVAPTRPHPGVESATANLLAGPFAAMLDRTRDALMSKGRE